MPWRRQRASRQRDGEPALLPLDLGLSGALHRSVATLNSDVPPLDAWVNNAGADILTGDGKALTRRQKLDAVLDVDLRGTVLASLGGRRLFPRRASAPA